MDAPTSFIFTENPEQPNNDPIMAKVATPRTHPESRPPCFAGNVALLLFLAF